MVKLSEMKRHPPKIILMGGFGTGKTALALTLGERAVVLDCDNGVATGMTLADKFKQERLNVEVKPCWEESADSAIGFSRALSYARSIQKEVKQGKGPEALVVDSFTTLVDMAVRQVLATNGKLGQNPQIQHWGLAFIQVETFLTIMKALPIVVIMTAHTMRYEEDGITKKGIACPGTKLPHKVPTYFDEVWVMKIRNLEQGKKAYLIQTQGTESVPARTRYNLPDETDANLGMVEILRLMGYSFPQKPQEGKKGA